MRAPFLDCIAPRFPGADADSVLNRRDKDLTVSDTAGLRGLLDGLDRLVQHVVAQDDLDFYLGQEINDVLCTTVKLGMALLATETFGFDHCDALQADFL